MNGVEIGVARSGPAWSVKHNGGFLGHVPTRSEALAIAHMLAGWRAASGRPTEIRIEDGAQGDGPPASRAGPITHRSFGDVRLS